MLSIPKKNSFIVRTKHHLYVYQIVNILNSINVNFLQFFVQQSKMMYTNMPRYKKVFQSSKNKFTKDKTILNHVEQHQVLDMANFEINFLSNYN